jgi:sialate O-acetylesterase
MPTTRSEKELADFFSAMPAMEFTNDIMPQHFPGALYEHMLKEIAPYGIRGILWYQGESDDEKCHAGLYQQMLTALIGDWRKLWEDQNLPFLIVQLPGYESWLANTKNMHYDLIRRAQELVTKTVPNTWLCSISDIGEQYDIHPKNKQPVGERLALLARGHVYGEKISCDAPEAVCIKKSGDRITILFDNAKEGLEVHGDKVNAIKVYSGDEEISWKGEIQGCELILHLQQKVTGMLQVEFAQEKFYEVNLYNKAGIPAIPFSLYQ